MNGIIERTNQLKVIKDKKCTILLINGVKCIVQSYLNNDFVNLSPVHGWHESLGNSLSNIRIDFVNHRFGTDGKENMNWKKFVSQINIEDVDMILKAYFEEEM